VEECAKRATMDHTLAFGLVMQHHRRNASFVTLLSDDVAAPPTTESEPSVSKERDVVFFDGVCNLCNGVVQFIIDRDKAGAIRFAPLQSDAAIKMLLPLGVTVRPEEPDSIILLTHGKDATPIAYERSTAVLRIAKQLSFPWPLLYYAGIVWPRFLRDVFYKFVATHRYKWFGKTETCRVPTPELRARFLA
jgi:predicted DCC family thiol-disulfide oxidoreductase YuxK